MLVRALLSAVLGTVAMTLSSSTEAALRERPPSDTPARAVAALLARIGLPRPGRVGMSVLSTWVHWTYGTFWGLVLWVLLDPGLLGLRLPAAFPVFLLAVWLAEQVHLPLLGVTPPSWRWGARELAIDFWHHLVYAAGTFLAWHVIGSAP